MEKLYSAEEVAKMVGRTGFTIREHLKKGILKGHKTATNRWVIRHKDVLAYMGIEEDEKEDKLNDEFVIYNRNLARNIGVNEAILYSELLSRWNYFKERGQLTEDGFFFITVKDLEEGTALSDYQQRRALNSLKEKGLIEMEVRGIPAKRYFRIVEDSELKKKCVDI